MDSSKSPTNRSQQLSNTTSRKRELGSNVRKTIASLQKMESASEDDGATSPLVNRKTRNVNSICESKASPKSPNRMTGKICTDNQGIGNQSKEKDGKRALVTTV